MGVIDRLGKVVRAEWSHRFGRRPTDPAPLDTAGTARRPRSASAVVDVDGALRVLELSGPRDLAEVRAQYHALARRYWPKTQSHSADDAHAARVVLEALTDALEVLEEHLLPLA